MDIIIKNKKLREKLLNAYNASKQFVLSMRFVITAAYFAVILVTLILVSTYMVGLMRDNQYQTSTVDMFEKANIIADAAAEQWDNDPAVTELRLAEITQRSLAGTPIRGIVTDSAYTVLYDTNTESGLAGKVYMRDVLKRALDGEQAQLISGGYDNGYITVSVPIMFNGEIAGGIYLAQNVSSIENTVDSLKAGLMFFCCIILIIIGLLSVGISIAVTAPLEEFKQAAAEISKGNFQKRIEAKGLHEFVQMGNSMNYMCDELSLIEERRKKFVSDVSHELKTPMASIKLVCDCLTQGENYDEAMVKEFLNDMSDEVDRLTRIVERLLELTKLDGNISALKLQECDIKELLNKIVRKLSEIAKENNITVYRDFVDNDYHSILIDEDKIYEALYNIIDNAIKYSQNGGYVKIDAKETEEYIIINVEDTGDGIPEAEKEHIFERFYRLDNSRSRDTGGTGLGLAIAKEVVSMHKGTIEIIDGRDKGSIFKICIPREKLAQSDVQV